MIPVNQISLDGNEAKYLAECVSTNWISAEGPFVARLEKGVARLTGRRHAIAVMNGSVALDLAVAALGIGAGDEVILPSFTIISCAAALLRAGALPVVVDCEPATWNMDPAAVEAKITPRTKAIMAVHIYGLPVNMDPIWDIAARHDLKIIEDAAEEIGQIYWSEKAPPALTAALPDEGAEFAARIPRTVGSLADLSTLSFYPNKHITTGEGGMVLSDDDALAERCRALRNLSFGKKGRFIHEELGWNFRMSNLQAAVGVAQLERVSETIAKKREIGRWYNELLADLPWLQRPLERTEYARNIYWVYGVVLADDVPIDAEEAMKRLAEKGVGTRPFFWPMHQQPVLRRLGLFGGEACPVAERIARRGFYLPSGVALERNQAEQVALAVRDLFSLR